jgi:putative salt-induced outer membrane protein
MRYSAHYLVAATLAVFPAAAHADPVPGRVADMLKAAVDDGDPAELAATAKVAKKTNPASAAEIDAMVASLQAEADAAHKAKLARQGFFEGWTGQGEAGLASSTGNTRSTDLALGLHFSRIGLNWDHALDATVDYQRTNGIESKSRYFAGYSGRYKFDGPLYGVGVLSWEGDRFMGFDSRMSESIGLGYAILQSPDMQLSIEAGPALRQTDYISGGSENSFAGRAAINYKWDILPSLAFTQSVSYYGESRDSTVISDTGLTANLIGALSARLSYHVQYESNPPLGLQNTDTTSRLTLVYNFD